MKTALVLAVLLTTTSADASARPDPAALRCVHEVATHFDVPAIILEIVLTLEGGRSGKIVRHHNGAVDIGAAQINTQHLPRLAHLGVDHARLRDDPCLNLATAAWHLRRDFNRHQGSIAVRWREAMLDYHSRTPQFRDAYASRVERALRAR